MSDRPEEWPIHWWRSGPVAAQLSHEFACCVVPMHVAYLVARTPRSAWCSGWLLWLADELLLWMTAAHVIEEILKLRDDPTVSDVTARLVDDHPYANGEKGIPIALHGLPCYSADRLDFGAVLIRPGYAAPLLKNPNIRPVKPETWIGNASAKPEGYYVVGVPAAFGKSDVCDKRGGVIRGEAGAFLMCLPLELLKPSEYGKGPFWEHPGHLFGRLIPFTEGDSPETASSIQGMSGGMVVGIKRRPKDGLWWHLFGIQSAWLPESRIIRAVPIEMAVNELADFFRQLGAGS